VPAFTVAMSHSQNCSGFVRVVHAEDLHALRDPVHDAALRRDAGGVVVEVERVDVLVLLRGSPRRRSCRPGAVNHSGCAAPTGDRAPAARGRARPRVPGRGLHEPAEVGESGCTASWPPRPRRWPRGSGTRGRACCCALAVDLADRVDRRQVHDVEAHRGDGRQALAAVRNVPLIDAVLQPLRPSDRGRTRTRRRRPRARASTRLEVGPVGDERLSGRARKAAPDRRSRTTANASSSLVSARAGGGASARRAVPARPSVPRAGAVEQSGAHLAHERHRRRPRS
jgi:hypothetical protein